MFSSSGGNIALQMLTPVSLPPLDLLIQLHKRVFPLILFMTNKLGYIKQLKVALVQHDSFWLIAREWSHG